MKLATYRDGSRDGQLIVVSRDLSMAHHATGIASRLQQVLDDWNFLSPQLQDLSVTLNHGRARHAFAFDPRQCMAPLPRAFHCVLAAPAAAADDPAPAAAPAAALLTALPGDHFLGPCQDVRCADPGWQIGCDAGLAVLTGDVAQGASDTEGLDGVRLLMLAAAWHVDAAASPGAAAVAPLPAHLALSFGPVAVTPDELGAAWQGGRLQAALQLLRNGRRVGPPQDGADLPCHVGALVARLTRTRALAAGSIVLAAAASAPSPAASTAQPADSGTWLVPGDRLRLGLADQARQDLLGCIEQQLGGPQAAPADAADMAPAAGGPAVD